MYKKIFLEVTNICNLNCPFCIDNNRKKEFITIDNFKIILKKLKGYTNYLYFHVSGEPLMHPMINELINIASKDYFINITTNGYLINKIKDNKNIRQINISLHSYNPNEISLDTYLNNIVEVINNLHNNTYFSLRFWINNSNNKKILDYLSKKINKKIELIDGLEVIKNVYISLSNEFIWPDLSNDFYDEKGRCYALKDHIGILVNGDIIPCCLDALGVIKLGNIYNNTLDEIIKSDRYQNMLKGFTQNKKCELLCKKCNYYNVNLK